MKIPSDTVLRFHLSHVATKSFKFLIIRNLNSKDNLSQDVLSCDENGHVGLCPVKLSFSFFIFLKIVVEPIFFTTFFKKCDLSQMIAGVPVMQDRLSFKVKK